MKTRTFLILLTAILLFSSCHKNDRNTEAYHYRIPRIAFVTTGNTLQNGTLPAGVQVASHFFNSHGAVMVNTDRKILTNPDLLAQYDILILSSAAGYHDADREYSLTFMSDDELENIEKWVKNGGYLIAGDNIGRNNEEGSDRISLYGRLQPQNWPLSNCFGVILSEQNINGFSLVQSSGKLPELNTDTLKTDTWVLVADSILSKKLKIFAEWRQHDVHFPAFIQNSYENGTAILFPSSYYLHVTNQGGFWDMAAIEQFYEYVLDDYYRNKTARIEIHPWPDASPYAFCATIQPYGSKKQLESLLRLCRDFKIPVTATLTGKITEENLQLLKDYRAELASSGYKRLNFRDKSYLEAWSDMVANESRFHLPFKGFRFPFTTTSANGLLSLDELGYQWESSLGYHPDLFSGCLFPYHLPVSMNGYFKTSRIMEISPTYHDDYYFLDLIENNRNIQGRELLQAASLYRQYLLDYLSIYVKKYKGQMTWIGHPAYTAYNDTLLSVPETLFKKVSDEKGWATSPSKMTEYRNAIENIQVFVKGNQKGCSVTFKQNQIRKIEGFTLVLHQEPKQVKVKYGSKKLMQNEKSWFLVFDAYEGQEITITY